MNLKLLEKYAAVNAELQTTLRAALAKLDEEYRKPVVSRTGGKVKSSPPNSEAVTRLKAGIKRLRMLLNKTSREEYALRAKIKRERAPPQRSTPPAMHYPTENNTMERNFQILLEMEQASEAARKEAQCLAEKEDEDGMAMASLTHRRERTFNQNTVYNPVNKYTNEEAWAILEEMEAHASQVAKSLSKSNRHVSPDDAKLISYVLIQLAALCASETSEVQARMAQQRKRGVVMNNTGRPVVLKRHFDITKFVQTEKVLLAYTAHQYILATMFFYQALALFMVHHWVFMASRVAPAVKFILRGIRWARSALKSSSHADIVKKAKDMAYKARAMVVSIKRIQ